MCEMSDITTTKHTNLTSAPVNLGLTIIKITVTNRCTTLDIDNLSNPGMGLVKSAPTIEMNNKKSTILSLFILNAFSRPIVKIFIVLILNAARNYITAKIL